MAASYDYANSVMQKLNNLPTEYRLRVIQKEDEYTDYELTLVYKQTNGVKMGRRNDPLVMNKKGEWGYSTEPGFTVKRLEDGSVDWSDPNIISPYLEERENVNYNEMDALIMQEAENAGLTWNVEKTTAIVGKISVMPPFDDEPHPLFAEDNPDYEKPEKNEEEEEPET